jgi:hypothetical protein
MSRQVIDGMIIAAVVGLAVAHLYVGGFTRRWVIRPDQLGRSSETAARAATEPSDDAAMVRPGIAGDGLRNDARASAVTVRIGKWVRSVDGGAQQQSQTALNDGRGYR